MKIWSFFLACCLVAAGVTDVGARQKAVRSGTVIYTIRLLLDDPAQKVRLWLPYPDDNAGQTVTDVKVGGNFQQPQLTENAETGTKTLHVAWKKPDDAPQLNLIFHVASTPVALPELKEIDEDFPDSVAVWRNSDKQVAGSRFIRNAVSRAVKGRSGVLDKARGIYEWTIANTSYDTRVKGVGKGNPVRTLDEAEGRGGSADISSVFVAVLRAAGIPAREVCGLLPDGKSGNITQAFHVWAEFYVPGAGWVSADPAAVRKTLRERQLQLRDAEAAEVKEFFWGGGDVFRVILSRGSRIKLEPEQQGALLDCFLLPYAEVDGKRLDALRPEKFFYQVDFKAD